MELTVEFRKIHQFNAFTTVTPMQWALADFVNEHPENYLELPDFYQQKRDLFCELLADSRFTFKPSQGTYFQLLDYSQISQEEDVQLARRWTKEVKVASIPISVFYADSSQLQAPVLRFCFAKQDETLKQAAEILCQI